MDILIFYLLCDFISAGITVDKYGVIFFVDGTMIRRIDQNGIISTLLGFNDLTSARPLSCDAVMDISQVRPLWPGQLACILLSINVYNSPPLALVSGTLTFPCQLLFLCL